MFQDSEWTQVHKGHQAFLLDNLTPDTRTLRVVCLEPSFECVYNTSIFHNVVEKKEINEKEKRAFYTENALFYVNKSVAQSAERILAKMELPKIKYFLSNITNFSQLVPLDRFLIRSSDIGDSTKVITKECLEVLPLLLKAQGHGARVETNRFQVEMTAMQRNANYVPVVNYLELKDLLERYNADKSRITLVFDVSSQFPYRT
ncbi:unnamed protein product [Caenorhabditis sp. 36 PRJEB53466]|nr:unnamed protein product [Caenorhabditis sp. 36 PRJEB53466]